MNKKRFTEQRILGLPTGGSRAILTGRRSRPSWTVSSCLGLVFMEHRNFLVCLA